MLTVSLSRRLFVRCALPLALWAAVPEVRWCPLDLQACAAAFAGTAATPVLPAAACAEAAREATRACDETAGCPAARTTARSASDESCANAAGCPLARAVASTPVAPRSQPFGRMFCVGDPNGGAGTLASAVYVPAPLDAFVLTPELELSAPAVLLARVVPQLAGRPPPEPWLRRPPARAPPALRWS